MYDNVTTQEEFVEIWMGEVLMIAGVLCEDAWHKAGVCKYMRTLLRDMTRTEIGTLTEEEVTDLTQHAAEGFDRWRRRRLL